MLWIACSDCKGVALKVIGNLATNVPTGKMQVMMGSGQWIHISILPCSDP